MKIKTDPNGPEKSPPPGKLKIAEALRQLLEERDFNSITTAEIAKTAGVNEALIYRYYNDKRGLLHQVLFEYLEPFVLNARKDIEGVQGAFNKLRKVIWFHINAYATKRIFGKILILEARGSVDYFKSETYQLARQYTSFLLDLIKDGIDSGEIREGLPPEFIRNVIIGGIEYICFTSVAFNRDLSVDEMTDNLCRMIFKGIAKDPGSV